MKLFVILIFSLSFSACDSVDNNESNNSQSNSTIDKIVVDETSVDKPITNKPLTNKPIIDKPVVDDNAVAIDTAVADDKNAVIDTTVADDKAVVSEIIPVVGTWTQLILSVNCIETFTFNSDNSFSGTSLNESFSGTYTFTSQSDSQLNSQSNSSNRHPFSLKVTNDNQQPDCEGDSTNDTGSAFDIIVEFPNETVMNWYLHSSDDVPVATLNRQ